MKVHEYLEKKLLADHGEIDEKERPGITGNDVEAAEHMTEIGVPAAAEGQADIRTDSPTIASAHAQDSRAYSPTSPTMEGYGRNVHMVIRPGPKHRQHRLGTPGLLSVS